MKHLSAYRIAGPTTAVSLLLLLVGASGAWYVHRLQKRTSEMLDHNVSSIRASVEVELKVRELRTELNRFLLSGNADHLADASGIRGQVNYWLERARQCATTKEEQLLMQALDRDLSEFFVKLNSTRRLTSQEEKQAAIRTLSQDLLTEDILAAARTYLDLNERDLDSSRRDSQTMTGNVMLGQLLLGACGSAAGLLAGYAVARSVNRSLFHLSVPIRDVAGKLNEVVGPITISADPRFEDLQDVLGKVSEKVTAVVDQLQGTHREMVRADQLAAIGQMAAGLAHELRNPLMAMKLLVQSAFRADAASRSLSDRDIKILDEEITRLEILLQTFLDFARPARLEKQMFDLQTLVAPSLQLLSRRAELKGINVKCHLADASCHVEADPLQIRQVLLNLLLNALEATPRGGTVEIQIRKLTMFSGDSATRLLAPGDWVALSVADTGDGLPTGVRERIFEPFFSTRDTGLGLGLAICKRIVESHGGVISAENRAQGGALFNVILPAAAHVGAEDHAARPEAPAASAAISQYGKEHAKWQPY